jgi:hypothetical protein
MHARRDDEALLAFSAVDATRRVKNIAAYRCSVLERSSYRDISVVAQRPVGFGASFLAVIMWRGISFSGSQERHGTASGIDKRRISWL